MTHKHRWRFGRSEKVRFRARECMDCGLTQILLTEGSTQYATVPVTVVPVPEWLEANPHWRKHWESKEEHTNGFVCPRCKSKKITLIFSIYGGKEIAMLRYRCDCEEVFELRYRKGDWYKKNHKWKR